ncbi:MAG: hypothetical protein ACOYON_12240 [Fimbriimonas sp.]
MEIRSSTRDPELLRAQIRQWKAGMEAANRFALEEARRRTPAERLQNHQNFLAGHAQIGLAREKPEDRIHRIPYHELQERWLAGSAKRKLGH